MKYFIASKIRNDYITPSYRYCGFRLEQAMGKSVSRSRFRRRSNGGKPYHTKLFALDKALWNRENNGRPFNKH